MLTIHNEEHMLTSINNFKEIEEEMQELGINLYYEFKDLHDRSIESNTGWKIIPGRGLDIFEPREGWYNVGDLYQERRKCKNCTISYLRK